MRINRNCGSAMVTFMCNEKNQKEWKRKMWPLSWIDSHLISLFFHAAFLFVHKYWLIIRTQELLAILNFWHCQSFFMDRLWLRELNRAISKFLTLSQWFVIFELHSMQRALECYLLVRLSLYLNTFIFIWTKEEKTVSSCNFFKQALMN